MSSEEVTDDSTDDGTPDNSGIYMTIFSALSIAASFLVLLTVLFPHLRRKSAVMVIVYISASNLLSATGSIFGYAEDGTAACVWEGFATNMSNSFINILLIYRHDRYLTHLSISYSFTGFLCRLSFGRCLLLIFCIIS